jgi:precorrin-3B synthase
MRTGDGLLVRLHPLGTMSLQAFADLCRAARTHGNGVVEVTSRGSIQVRGLSAASASLFATAVAELGIAAADGIPILVNPLAGLDVDEIIDAEALAADLRLALTQRALASRLAAKVSVAVDGCGALHLDALAADVRLSAQAIKDEIVLHIMVGGEGASATHLGYAAASNGVEVTTRLLDVLAGRGRNARTHDVIAAEGVSPFCSAIADLLIDGALPPAVRPDSEPIGRHRLRDGSSAYGVGMAFGHADASVLEGLAEAAAVAGARGLRAAPGRALLVIGLADDVAAVFAAAVERLGFIVRKDDPRWHVIACAGVPVCASAYIASRSLGPLIAQVAEPYIGEDFSIHISGCIKGCAHPKPAALTIVGTPDGCALVANGSPRDAPFASVATPELSAAIAEYARTSRREAGHG